MTAQLHVSQHDVTLGIPKNQFLFILFFLKQCLENSFERGSRNVYGMRENRNQKNIIKMKFYNQDADLNLFLFFTF